MDSINTSFLDPSFASTLNNMATNKKNIIKIMTKFIGDSNDLVTAIKSKAENQKNDFLQVNVALFKAHKMYIFYMVGYDYAKLQKIERFFYRFLYVADKLINMYDTTKTESEYTKYLKKYFTESNNFARKASNPFNTKGEEKFNDFFKKLEKNIIEPPRLIRQKYKEELNALDEKVKTTQNMLSATEQEEIKVRKAIKNLLEEHSKDPKTAKIILDMIISGTGIVYTPSDKASSSGGKAKRRPYRRRIIRGGTLAEGCIVKYLTNIVNINKIVITNLGNGRYKVEDITAFKENSDLFEKRSVLPEVTKLIENYNKPGNDNLKKIKTADKLIKAFNLAIQNIDNTKTDEAFTAALSAAVNAVTNALEHINKQPASVQQSDDNPNHSSVGGFVQCITTNEQKKAANLYDMRTLNTTVGTFITQLEGLLKNEDFAFKIIKYKYDNHPMVILNNKLESLV